MKPKMSQKQKQVIKMLLFSILTNQFHNSRSAFQTKLMLPKIHDGVVLKQQDKILLYDADTHE